MAITIRRNTLVEVEVLIFGGNLENSSQPVLQIINRTSIAHNKRTDHKFWWNPANTLSPSCDCTLHAFKEDIPAFPPVSDHELTVLPRHRLWVAKCVETLGMSVQRFHDKMLELDKDRMRKSAQVFKEMRRDFEDAGGVWG